jgi:predicted Ser/Thr protein kinase
VPSKNFNLQAVTKNGNVDYVQYEALREALKSGDWKAVEEFLER